MQKSGYFFSVLYPSTVRLDGNFFFLKYSHKILLVENRSVLRVSSG